MKIRIKIFSFICFVVCILSSCNKEQIPDPLANTEWEVMSMSTPGHWGGSVSPYPYTLVFQDDGSLSILLEFNTCQGVYKVKNRDKINIQSFGCTENGGEDEFADSLVNNFAAIYFYELYNVVMDNEYHEGLMLYSPNKTFDLKNLKFCPYNSTQQNANLHK